jgi:OOP family OmpA-OmpF porin
MSSKLRLWICSLLSLALFTLPSFADVPGAKDPANIKRYEGSEIIRNEVVSFDRYVLPLGKMNKFDFTSKVGDYEKSETLEGQITRVSYRIAAPDRSSFEVFRNYQNALNEAGWEILWTGSGKAELGHSFTSRYQTLRDNDQLFSYSDAQTHFLSAQKPAEGLSAALFVTKYEYGLTRGIKMEKGDPIVQLDVIKAETMENKMVLVTSSEIAKSIDSSGSVALYGILFDFNSAEIKPESEATLAQLADFLKNRTEQQLLVVGHTDNIGSFESNRALSEKRAASVINFLSQKHGIASNRLSAFGASFAAPVASNTSEDGRSKNRRVEVVEGQGR